MATLASETPGTSVARTVSGSSWQERASVTVDTTGDVTSITIRLTANSAIGTGNANFRLVRSSIVISTGSKDITTIPDLPTGFPDGIDYVISMSSVRITAAEIITLEVQREVLSGVIILQTHGEDVAPYETHLTVTGDAYTFTPPVPSGPNNMKTIRRLVASANNKIWYEDV